MSKPLTSLIFQVRSNSELGQVLQAISEGAKSDKELEAITGFKRSGSLLRQFGQNFDNLITSLTHGLNGVKVISLGQTNSATQLRVKPGSELDRMVRLIQERGPQTGKALENATGFKRSPAFLRLVGQNFDNFKVFWTQGQDSHDVEYIDLDAKNVTINVEQGQFNGAGQGSIPQQPQDLSQAGQLVWPEAPPLLEGKPWFRQPSWHREMAAMVEAGCHISLEGPPSVGKDTGIKELAAAAGVPLVTKLGAGMRKRDFVGTAQMVNGTTVFLVDEFAAAVVNGWWAVVTEVNAAEPDVTVFLNGILDEPFVINIQGKQYPVHPDFRLFVDYNHGLHGVKPLNQAFKDRFHPIKLGWLTEPELRERLVAHGMPRTEDLGTILVNGETQVNREVWPDILVSYGMAMAARYASGRTRYHITMRRLLGVVTLMNGGVYNDIRKAIRSAVINGIDSEGDNREAETVLREVCAQFGS